MGVCIWYTTPRGRQVIITPGWRSMMHGILLDRCLYGELNYKDIPQLKEAAREQRKGEREPPFDWSDEIEERFYDLVAAIRKYEYINLNYDH